MSADDIKNKHFDGVVTFSAVYRLVIFNDYLINIYKAVVR